MSIIDFFMDFDVTWCYLPHVVGCVSSRWDFIQGESALFRRIAGSNKPTNLSGIRRRIQKKVFVTKQKLEELDNVASGLSQVAHLVCSIITSRYSFSKSIFLF